MRRDKLNYNLVNLIQLMFLIIWVTSVFSYALYSYKNIKHKAEANATKNILIQWLEFIKGLCPEDYIIYEKYGIWRYLSRFKIEMMF